MPETAKSIERPQDPGRPDVEVLHWAGAVPPVPVVRLPEQFRPAQRGVGVRHDLSDSPRRMLGVPLLVRQRLVEAGRVQHALILSCRPRPQYHANGVLFAAACVRDRHSVAGLLRVDRRLEVVDRGDPLAVDRGDHVAPLQACRPSRSSSSNRAYHGAARGGGLRGDAEVGCRCCWQSCWRRRTPP